MSNNYTAIRPVLEHVWMSDTVVAEAAAKPKLRGELVRALFKKRPDTRLEVYHAATPRKNWWARDGWTVMILERELPLYKTFYDGTLEGYLNEN